MSFDDLLTNAITRGDEAKAQRSTRPRKDRQVSLSLLVRADIEAHPEGSATDCIRRVMYATGMKVPTSLTDDEAFEAFTYAAWAIRSAYQREMRKFRKANGQ